MMAEFKKEQAEVAKSSTSASCDNKITVGKARWIVKIWKSGKNRRKGCGKRLNDELRDGLQ